MVFPGVGPARPAPTRTPPAAGPAPAGDLVAPLKGGRLRLARAEDVPPYVIAPNRTLEAMASSKPTTTAALHDVHGMGPGRISKYGSAFLEAMAAWTQGG
jgi:ATP-dependent DNA helicase RecQ